MTVRVGQRHPWSPCWRSRASAPGKRAGIGGDVASIAAEPAGGGGTASRVAFTLDFEGHGLGVPLVPLVRRQAEKAAPASYDSLQRLLETGR